MTTEFNWSWVDTASETAKESGAVLQDGGTVFSLRQAYNGQVSGSDLNAFSTSVGQNFQSVRSNWRLYTRPILNSLPAGGSDSRWTSAAGKALPDKIDCFKYGVQGTTLFVFNDADSTKADGRYWHSDDLRPKTIAEKFEDLYSDISDISDSLTVDTAVDLDPLWAAIGEDYRDSAKVGSSGSLDTRVNTTESYLSQINIDVYEPATFTYGLGTPLPYSVANMVNELLQLHNGSGWGADPSVITHTGVTPGAHVHPYNEIQPALTQSLTQARVAPYDSIENDILRLRYEIAAVKGVDWYQDAMVPYPETTLATNLQDHVNSVGSGGSNPNNPHGISYVNTGASTIFDAVTSFTGMTSNTDSNPTYSSTNYVTQSASLETTIGELDAGLATVAATSSFWARASSILSPYNVGDGLSVDATGSNTVSLYSDNGLHLESGSVDLSLKSVNADVTLLASGTSSDIGISTFSDTGNMTIDLTQSTSGVFYVNVNDMQINTPLGFLLTNEDLSNPTGTITVYADGGGGLVTITTGPPHTLHPGDSITISGSTNYNNSYVVASVASTFSFQITATWVADDGVSTWTLDDSFGDEGPAFIRIGNKATSDPIHLYSSHSDILIETVAAACLTNIRLVSGDGINMTAPGGIDATMGWASDFKLLGNNATPLSLTLSSVNTGGSGHIALDAQDNLDLTCTNLTINGTPGVDFSGAVTNITVVDGIVTAAS